MSTPPLPANETERLTALHRYKILDTPPEAAFDRITTLAARLFDVPISLISLVDESRAWFKSCLGFGASEVARDDTLCSFAVLFDQPLIVPDARLDDRFACNPFVQQESGVRFYAGAPLLSQDGFNLGTLCLLDTQPREPLTAAQQATLVDLAAVVVDELELRLAAQKIAQVDAALLKITQGVATATGVAFFDALVQHFAYVLDVDYVYIGLVEGDDPQRMRTIATCAQGQIVENLEYLLQETPCWEVLQQGKICCYPRNVQDQFPHAPLLKSLSIESYVAAPFFDSNGTALGLLGVMDDQPLENVHLAESLLMLFADRIATELERQQAEVTLSESEEKYRSLFESIDEGFCVVEVLLDAHHTPIDYRILEVNTIFKQQTGLQQAVGKTARQLNLEEHWIEIYGRVALTGEPIRFENGSETLNRWFDVYACRTGEPEDRRVAIVFKDISDRKRREANLAFLANIAEDSSRLSTAEEIMQTISAKLSAYLNISYCLFAEIDAAQDRVVVEYAWNPADPTDLVGIYQLSAFVTEEFQQAARIGETIVICDTQTDARTDANSYAAFNIHAFVTVPFHRNDEWKYLLTVNHAVPRDWREDEIELVRELANRVFPRLERARAEAIVAADLQDMQRLRELSARLVIEGNIQTLYQEILSTAIALTRADAGTVQILDETTQNLVLFAAQGFKQNMTEHFYHVNARSNTPCGIALRSGDRTFVNFDVPEREDPNGSMRMHTDAGYLSAQSTPLITRSGKAIGMVSTHWREHRKPSDRELRFLDLLARQASDLIEQRQAAAEREQLLVREQAARAEADRANRIKDEFLAVLSHELRSPLNPILGWTRLLQKGNLDRTRQATALETIERNAKLQSQLIEDLLDISRIMQGKLSLAPASVSLTFVISAAIETVRLAAEAKQIQIILNLDSTLPPISGDAARLQQVVWNLLTNAVKFTPSGGQVTVELKPIDQMAQICITDTGKGIVPQFLPHVFEYFRQEDGSTTRRFGGLGLGLAIVRQIVEMHGGRVQAASQGENQGATFRVLLPILSQATFSPPETAYPSASAELPLAEIQVLVVDDDTDTREFQAFLLEQSGAKVVAVASGADALKVFDRWIPDVLVSDVGMAEMDGHTLIQQIRARPPAQGGTIPAIALTAYAAEVDQQKAMRAGFQVHLTKPVEPYRLVESILNLLGG